MYKSPSQGDSCSVMRVYEACMRDEGLLVEVWDDQSRDEERVHQHVQSELFHIVCCIEI